MRAQDDGEADGGEKTSGGVAKTFKKSSSSLARIAAAEEKARGGRSGVLEATPPARP